MPEAGLIQPSPVRLTGAHGDGAGAHRATAHPQFLESQGMVGYRLSIAGQ